MGYLNNIKLNSNTYSVGTEIKKLNLNGTIYTLGLDTSDATLTSEWQLSEGITAYSNAKKYTGVVKDHATVGKNGVTETVTFGWKFYPNSKPDYSIDAIKIDPDNKYIGFLIDNGYYDGYTYVGSKPYQLGINHVCIGYWGSNSSYTPVYLGAYFEYNFGDHGLRCLENGTYKIVMRSNSQIINNTLILQKNGIDSFWGNSDKEGFSSIDSEVSLVKGDSLHIRIDEKGLYGQTSVGFEFTRIR